MRGAGATLRVSLIAGLALFGLACASTPPLPSTLPSGAPPSGSPAAGSTTPPATGVPTAQPSGDEPLPTPSTTDVVLLVADPAAPTAREAAWLADLRTQYGRVDAVAYRDASVDRLDDYFTVFVIDKNSELDVAVVAQAFASGLTIHLIGSAAGYQADVAGGAP